MIWVECELKGKNKGLPKSEITNKKKRTKIRNSELLALKEKCKHESQKIKKK